MCHGLCQASLHWCYSHHSTGHTVDSGENTMSKSSGQVPLARLLSAQTSSTPLLPRVSGPSTAQPFYFAHGCQMRVILLPPVTSMHCCPRSASPASRQTLDMACCRIPSSQPAVHLSDRTLLCYHVALHTQKDPHRKHCSFPINPHPSPH